MEAPVVPVRSMILGKLLFLELKYYKLELCNHMVLSFRMLFPNVMSTL